MLACAGSCSVSKPALGQWVRIDDRRFRVIGILGEGGESLGQNLDDMAVIPVASAQSLFDAPSLFRVLIQARSAQDIEKAQRAAREIIRERHDGEDDVTIITQDALLATFDGILRALTYTVGGIAGISLAVAGILIMNVMLVAVSQRVAEIGLLKALGAPESQVLRLFLVESILLASAGAALGMLVSAVAHPGTEADLPRFSDRRATMGAAGRGRCRDCDRTAVRRTACTPRRQARSRARPDREMNRHATGVTSSTSPAARSLPTARAAC